MPRIEIEERYWTPVVANVKRITKRMKEAGVEVTWTTSQGPEVPLYNEDGKKIGRDFLLYVDFNTLAPALPGGWRLVGVIEHGEKFNVIRPVPDEDFSLTPSCVNAAPTCDHCGTKRACAKTFFLVDEEGEIKRVRSICIRGLFGKDIEYLLKCAGQLLWAIDPDSLKKRGPHMLSTDVFLEWVAFFIRVGGWVSSKDAKLKGTTSTANHVKAALITPGERDRILAGFDCLDEASPSLEDEKNAANARAWAASMKSPATNWATNINNMSKEDYFPVKNIGLIASIVSGYYVHLHRIVEREAEFTNALNEYVPGALKSTITIAPATVVYVRPGQGKWGPFVLYKFRDPDERMITWFSSRDHSLAVGDRITLRGHIKKFGEYEGRKETLLTQCKVTAYKEEAI